MYDITLICSSHKEHGKCNSNELHNIIEKINPEIIFEEITPSDFNACYNGQRFSRNLEANARKKNLQKHQIEHIPVDNYDLNNFDKKDIDYMFDKIFDHEEYCNLHNKFYLLLNQRGFPFLNSGHCDEIFDKLHMLEEIIIKNANDDKLFCAYKLWTEIQDERENEMINNVYRYSKEHRFNTGLFLIGAAHRKSIINKIQKHSWAENVKLYWNIGNYDNIF